ncbi:MAG: hypothetical protein E4H36_07175 [Spirochaetales bacterium]|nr:MAG: hypothetical protein E4H36_07175 [Spirochaetales bacterium]
MDRTVLIASRENFLVYELTRRYLEKNYNVICTISKSSLPDDFGSVEENFSKSLLNLDINWKSPLSVRSLLLKGLTKFGSFQESIIIHSPVGEIRPLHEVPMGSIEEIVDSGIKGFIFLLKELLSHYWKRKEGFLFPVVYTHGSEVLPPLDSAVAGAFVSAVESMFTFYKSEPIIINAFESKSVRTGDFADFMMKTIQEKAKTTYGRWFRFNDKTNLFSSLSINLPGSKR